MPILAYCAAAVLQWWHVYGLAPFRLFRFDRHAVDDERFFGGHRAKVRLRCRCGREFFRWDAKREGRLR